MVCLTVRDRELKIMHDFLSPAHKRRQPHVSTIIFGEEESDSISHIPKFSPRSSNIEDDNTKEISVAYLNQGDFFG